MTPKNIKAIFKTVIVYLIKFKRVSHNIWKQSEDISQDFISCQMKNCLKSWLKPKTHKQSKDILTSVLKVLVNLKWTKELFQEWYQWKNKMLIFQRELMWMKEKKKVMLRDGCLKLRVSWLILWKKLQKLRFRTKLKELIGSENGQLRQFWELTWSDGQTRLNKPFHREESNNSWLNWLIN